MFALLLNSTYEPLAFISERRALKLLFKEKVEILCAWDQKIHWISGSISYPSVLRLKKMVRRTYYNTTVSFTRHAITRRDQNMCQYCGEQLSPSQVTIDHVIPKYQNGTSDFYNCVTCCKNCNRKKGNMTPEQAGMKLLNKPVVPPTSILTSLVMPQDCWNDDWSTFLTSKNI